jgi:ketosteroid isomerase-like protein
MDDTRQVVEQYWQTMNTNDWEAVGALLHDEYVLDWPQSGERIRGRANFAAVNANYPAPGPWHFTVHQLIADEHGAASEVTVTAPSISTPVLSFFDVRGGKIWSMREYWPDPFVATAWRAPWVERLE